ncbi:DUF4191 domain-containing protein [Nocardioides terrisoli]|uniref:DUF4191 domain-containing protein n=1 Tax=Nocardioides terrisoli TaxID=3388267 RepID=UPI00287B5FEB|nr:DUF4191 domain-containing protein [Nocardioides marmorisolisilvae]
MARDKSKQGRAAQIIQTYRLTKQSDPNLGWILLGTFAVVGVIAFAVLFFVLQGIVFPIVFGILFGTLAALMVFGRRAQKAAFAQIEGKPGAAAAALGMLKRGWKIEPMIAFNKQQDLVTRLVGPPGIVLIGEGSPNRLKQLMSSERRKHERVASETAIHEVYVGDGEGQVPLRKLGKHMTKMKRTLKPAEMTDVLQRLKALDANRSAVPLPKGPVPTSMKGMRGNLRGR